MKLFMKLSSLTLALSMVLCACGGGGSTSSAPSESSASPDASTESSAPSASEAPSGDPVTLQYWFLGTDETTLTQVKDYVALFNEKFPNITVEMTGMSATVSEYETKLNAAVLSDTYPDILNIVLAQVGSRGVVGDFEPLQSYVDAWEDKDDIFDSAYEMGKYEGELIALGCGPDPKINVYRKDFFTAAGLDPEKPPKTWAELADAAEKLTIRDESGNVTQAGLAIPAVDSSLVFTEPFLRSNGSLVIDEANLKPSFTDPGAVEALQFLGDLAAKNVYIPFDYQNSEENPFLNNRAAMATVSVGPLRNFILENPDLKDQIGYMDIWQKDESTPGVAFCGYQLYAMGATSKHKTEAWEFIKHLMSPEIIWTRSEQRAFPPIRYSIESKYTELDPVMNPYVLEYTKNGKGKAAVAWVSIFNKYVSTAYEEVINGKKTAEQALNDANTALLAEIS